jgi:hypothetical protein
MPFGNLNVDTVTTSTAGGVLGAGNASIMKNRIINGAMVIDQRNAGASVTVASSRNYYLDRFSVFSQAGSKLTIQQNAGSVTPPAGFTNYAGITVSTAVSPLGAGDQYMFEQQIEGYNVADLDFGKSTAKTITLSFWVRSSLTGSFAGVIGNGAEDRNYPFTYTISAANTWEQKSVTIAGDTSGTWLTTNGVGLRLKLNLGTGTTYSGTANAWTSSAYISSVTGTVNLINTVGATWYVTGVQLEVGSSATGFEYVNYQTSLANCQRYYEKSYAQGTVAGTALSYPANSVYFNGWNTGSAQKVLTSSFIVVKRTAPTITYYDQAGTSGKITTLDTGGTATNGVSIALGYVDDSRYGAGANNGTYAGINYGWTASAEL